MKGNAPHKEKCFLTARGMISFGVLVLSFIIMSMLNSAILEQGVPEPYKAFISVTFSLLPIFMIVTWISFCWKWPNIFWLAMPLTVVTFLLVFLYEYFWLPTYESSKYSETYQEITKTADQGWGCANGWRIVRTAEPSKAQTVLRYILLSGTGAEPPYGLATDIGDGQFKIARHEDLALQAKIRNILRTCEGEELTLIKNLYFETLPKDN